MAELTLGGAAPPLALRELQQWRALWQIEFEEAQDARIRAQNNAGREAIG